MYSSRRKFDSGYNPMVLHQEAFLTKDETTLLYLHLTHVFLSSHIAQGLPSLLFDRFTSLQHYFLKCPTLVLFRLPSNMPPYARLSQTLLLISYQALLSDAACYNPDQSIPKSPYRVCNTTSGEHSACCGPGDPCTVNGYYFGSAGYMYRGGCTDITWQSPNCCPGCRDCTQSFPSSQIIHSAKRSS